jgi:DNA-binding LytR/AlgR family response regulator
MYRAIVIENMQDILEDHCRNLSLYDFEIVGSGDSVNDTIKLIKDHKPDVAFLDFDINGGPVTLALLQLHKERIPLPKVVFLSAKSSHLRPIQNNIADMIGLKYKYHLVTDFNFKNEERFSDIISQIKSWLQPSTIEFNNTKIHDGATIQESKSAPITIERERIILTGKGISMSRNLTTITKISHHLGYLDVYSFNDYEKKNNKLSGYAGTIGSVLEKLPSNFILINRSTIINIDYVSSINSADGSHSISWIFDRKETEPISLTHYKEVIELYTGKKSK